MPELATAWITLTATTKNMERDIKSALDRVDGGAPGRKVGEQFSKSVGASVQQASSGLRGSLNEMVSGITSQFGKAGKSVDSVFQSIPSKAALGAGAVLGIGTAAVLVGKQLYDLGAQWDEVVDSAAGRTGLLGDNLTALTNSIKETANVTASSIPEIGDIASRVTQSLHLTGKPLEEMTKNIADLNALTGDQLNVRELGKAYRAFGVDVRDQVPELNALWNASTATGIPINELIATIGGGAAQLKEFGFNIGESTSLIATFEDAGLNADSAVGGLRIALKNFADEGKEPQQALRDTVTEIKNLADAGNTAAATDLAAKTFGKGFAPFLDAIKSGKIDVDALNQSLQQLGPSTAPSIQQARDATSDLSEQFTILKNNLSTELEPAASGTFNAINGLITIYLINPLKQANEQLSRLKNLLSNPSGDGPSGPATLGPDGTPIAIPQPAAGSNPLGALSGGPSGSASRGRSPLDVFAPARAAGGPISGVGGPTSDIIPMWASNGEHVLTASDVNAMGGQAGVYAFRSALHRAGGGAVNDAALLANVPAGRYTQTQGADLTQGLADCSSAVEDLVNLLDGQSTAGRSMSTGNEAQWLTSRGFLPGMGGPGDFRVGFNSGHTQATLPGGTPFNWGSDAAAARRGIGGTGADDPAFTSHFYRPQDAGADITKAYADSLGKGGQAAVKDIKDQGGSTRSGMDGSSLGQSLVSGLLQGIGLDGSVFSDPLDWPNVKSGLALANWGGGLLKSALGGGQDSGGPDLTGGVGGGALSSIGLPSISGLLNSGAAPGGGRPYANSPSVVVNGNVGMDPRQFTQRVDAAQNQSWRRNMTAVRPG